MSAMNDVNSQVLGDVIAINNVLSFSPASDASVTISIPGVGQVATVAPAQQIDVSFGQYSAAGGEAINATGPGAMSALEMLTGWTRNTSVINVSAVASGSYVELNEGGASLNVAGGTALIGGSSVYLVDGTIHSVVEIGATNVVDVGSAATYSFAGLPGASLSLSPISEVTIDLVSLNSPWTNEATITGFVHGRDHLSFVGAGVTGVVVVDASGLSGTGAELGPFNVSGTSHPAYLIEVGAIGQGGAAAVAAAAAAIYDPGVSTPGQVGLSPSPTGSHYGIGVVFAGFDSSGAQELYSFQGDAGGQIHASELTHLVNLAGVQSLSASDFVVV